MIELISMTAALALGVYLLWSNWILTKALNKAQKELGQWRKDYADRTAYIWESLGEVERAAETREAFVELYSEGPVPSSMTTTFRAEDYQPERQHPKAKKPITLAHVSIQDKPL